MLELAHELKLLKLGNVSLDGTHIKANASIDQNVSYQRAVEIREQLRLDIDALLAQAETADAGGGGRAEAPRGDRPPRKTRQQDGSGYRGTGGQGGRHQQKAEAKYEEKKAERREKSPPASLALVSPARWNRRPRQARFYFPG